MRTIILVRKIEVVHKKVGGNLIASIALNDESLVSKSVRYVDCRYRAVRAAKNENVGHCSISV